MLRYITELGLRGFSIYSGPGFGFDEFLDVDNYQFVWRDIPVIRASVQNLYDFFGIPRDADRSQIEAARDKLIAEILADQNSDVKQQNSGFDGNIPVSREGSGNINDIFDISRDANRSHNETGNGVHSIEILANQSSDVEQQILEVENSYRWLTSYQGRGIHDALVFLPNMEVLMGQTLDGILGQEPYSDGYLVNGAKFLNDLWKRINLSDQYSPGWARTLIRWRDPLKLPDWYKEQMKSSYLNPKFMKTASRHAFLAISNFFQHHADNDVMVLRENAQLEFDAAVMLLQNVVNESVRDMEELFAKYDKSVIQWDSDFRAALDTHYGAEYFDREHRILTRGHGNSDNRDKMRGPGRAFLDYQRLWSSVQPMYREMNRRTEELRRFQNGSSVQFFDQSHIDSIETKMRSVFENAMYREFPDRSTILNHVFSILLKPQDINKFGFSY